MTIDPSFSIPSRSCTISVRGCLVRGCLFSQLLCRILLRKTVCNDKFESQNQQSSFSTSQYSQISFSDGDGGLTSKSPASTPRANKQQKCPESASNGASGMKSAVNLKSRAGKESSSTKAAIPMPRTSSFKGKGTATFAKILLATASKSNPTANITSHSSPSKPSSSSKQNKTPVQVVASPASKTQSVRKQPTPVRSLKSTPVKVRHLSSPASLSKRKKSPVQLKSDPLESAAKSTGTQNIIEKRLQMGLARNQMRKDGVPEAEINLLIPLQAMDLMLANTSVPADSGNEDSGGGDAIRDDDGNSSPPLKKNKSAFKKKAKTASAKTASSTKTKKMKIEASHSDPVEVPEHHGHVLTKLFGRKKKITWAYFSDFIKEHFSGPKKDDADISVEAKIDANDEEELLVFYQSDLLQAALMPEIITETRVPPFSE